MSGTEHYEEELAQIDHEILRYAAICGLNLSHDFELRTYMETPNDSWGDDKARQSLQGLLFLRLKLEAEMLEEGLVAPPLIVSTGATP